VPPGKSCWRRQGNAHDISAIRGFASLEIRFALAEKQATTGIPIVAKDLESHRTLSAFGP
jgi:hypothetical protein